MRKSDLVVAIAKAAGIPKAKAAIALETAERGLRAAPASKRAPKPAPTPRARAAKVKFRLGKGLRDHIA